MGSLNQLQSQVIAALYCFVLGGFLGVKGELQSDGKCRILALRGGGVHGVYELGALKALTDTLPEHEFAWDYISGVSIGAINAANLSLFEKGDEKAAVKTLEKLYFSYSTSDFFTFWPTVIFEPLWKSSMTDNTGMVNMLENVLGKEHFKRPLSFQSVDLNSGRIVFFDENTPLDIRNDAVRSSASIPGIFPPVEIDGMQLADGGLIQNISLGEPIQRCRAETSDENIIVDIILCFYDRIEIDQWTSEDLIWKSAYHYWTRKKEISNYYAYYEDIVRMTRGYPHVKFRYVISPSKTTPTSQNAFLGISLSATHEQLLEEMNLGFNDAYKAILEGDEKSGSEVGSNFRQWMEKMEGIIETVESENSNLHFAGFAQ